MRQETRNRWAARVARWQTSGLTAKAFAAQEGINAGTLSFWKWRLAQDASPAASTPPARRKPRAPSRASTEAVRFVEVLPTAPPVEATGAPFEVVVAGGRCIRVPVCFDEAALARLLTVVEAR